MVAKKHSNGRTNWSGKKQITTFLNVDKLLFVLFLRGCWIALVHLFNGIATPYGLFNTEI